MRVERSKMKDGWQKHGSRWAMIAVSFLLVVSCRGGGGGGGGGDGEISVFGNIKGSNADVRENVGWSVVFSDKETGICRVGTVGASGKYEATGVNPSKPMTIVLLDAQFKLRSVLSFPGLEVGQIRQFFTFSGDTLPTLIHQGGIVKFSDATDLSIQEDTALDVAGTSGDGIPDGMDTTQTSTALTIDFPFDPNQSESPRAHDGAPNFLLARSKKSDVVEASDTDADGIVNKDDPDIDADGIVNHFDINMDNDSGGLQNIFSPDADSTFQADVLEEQTESHFSQGVEYFVVQVVQVMTSATEFSTYLNFTTKLRMNPDYVTIRGSTTTLTSSSSVIIDDTTGVESTSLWDLTLEDDGLNGDGEENDQVYSRRVLLADGVVPTPGEVIFLSLQFGEDEDTAKYMDFPYIFPDMTTQVITPSTDGQGVNLTLANNPFLPSGATTGSSHYYWSLQLYDEELSPRQKVFDSDPIDVSLLAEGTATSNYTVPAGAVAAGTYKGYVTLQAKGIRLPGLPLWTITSQGFDLTITK